ncbi:hypothetical protein SOPP22_00430 [Shewanella sp. OPT22]|nr:hypothetical protein SOPP22_00430 [Shewanella sp. OPT22]
MAGIVSEETKAWCDMGVLNTLIEIPNLILLLLSFVRSLIRLRSNSAKAENIFTELVDAFVIPTKVGT